MKNYGTSISMLSAAAAALATSLFAAMAPDGPGTYFTPQDGTANVAIRTADRVGAVKRTVAFLGGSITEMNGFRPLVMKALREKFPSVDFTEIAAGLSSTCSDAGAFRLEEDVLSHGTPDLFIVEEAVNDDQDGHFTNEHAMRGMEGIVRHVLERNPFCAVVVALMPNKRQFQMILDGKTPPIYAVHRRVAEHYGAAVADVCGALVESARTGGMDWRVYRDCHPSPQGCAFAADVVSKAIGAVFNPSAQTNARSLPKAIDAQSYFQGRFLPFGVVSLGEGWHCSLPDWDKIPGSKRGYFRRGSIAWSEKEGAELSFSFNGTAAAAFLTAGPDAGDMDVSVDGGPARTFRLRANYGSLHYPYVQMMADGLTDGRHSVSIRVRAAIRKGRKCTALRIHRICVNGMD